MASNLVDWVAEEARDFLEVQLLLHNRVCWLPPPGICWVLARLGWLQLHHLGGRLAGVRLAAGLLHLGLLATLVVLLRGEGMHCSDS